MKTFLILSILFFSVDSYALFSTKSKKVKIPSIEGVVINNSSIRMSDLKISVNIYCSSEKPVPYSGCNRESINVSLNEDGSFHIPKTKSSFTYFRGDWVMISYSAIIYSMSDFNDVAFTIYTDSKEELIEALSSEIILKSIAP